MIPLESVGRRGAGRTPLIAGNWKMHTSLDDALELVEEMVDALDAIDGVDSLICPPFIWLPLVYENVEGTSIQLGAQHMHWADKGAFTGEIAPAMVAEFCTAVLIGHSERRAHFGATDETVNKTVHAALAHDLTPIICVGETLAQREAGETTAHIAAQVRAALAGVPAEAVADLVIAYEPIWAIGTGRAATPADAAEVIAGIRRTVAEVAGDLAATGLRILYGGSVGPKTIADLMARPEIDGALVGGASLNAADFVTIAETAARARR